MLVVATHDHTRETPSPLGQSRHTRHCATTLACDCTWISCAANPHEHIRLPPNECRGGRPSPYGCLEVMRSSPQFTTCCDNFPVDLSIVPSKRGREPHRCYPGPRHRLCWQVALVAVWWGGQDFGWRWLGFGPPMSPRRATCADCSK
jgi:hypothetical protein